MTDEEKKQNPCHETTGGFIKAIPYKEAWLNSWINASDGDKELLYKLPNFDKAVFKEITGIDIDA